MHLEALHGGVISTLIDNAGWFTASPYYDTWINTIDLQVQFLKPVSNGIITSVGEVVKIGKTIAFTNMQVFNQDNVLIAKGSGTFAVSNIPLELGHHKK